MEIDVEVLAGECRVDGVGHFPDIRTARKCGKYFLLRVNVETHVHVGAGKHTRLAQHLGQVTFEYCRLGRELLRNYLFVVRECGIYHSRYVPHTTGRNRKLRFLGRWYAVRISSGR